MNELIKLDSGKEVITSLEISEITGKQHAHVMRDIRNLIDKLKNNQSTSGLVENDFSKDYHRSDRTQYKFLSEHTQNAILNFAFGQNQNSQYLFQTTQYKDSKGEYRVMYLLNKKACLLLASGYDVPLRAKIIDRWEELELKERATLPTSFAEALQLAANQAREIEENQKLIEAQKQQLDESKAWYTIKRRAMIKGINWKLYNWRAMKRLSVLADTPIKKVFDANYGEVNLYHISIFETYEKTLNLN